jgi:hypothetical protein
MKVLWNYMTQHKSTHIYRKSKVVQLNCSKTKVHSLNNFTDRYNTEYYFNFQDTKSLNAKYLFKLCHYAKAIQKKRRRRRSYISSNKMASFPWRRALVPSFFFLFLAQLFVPSLAPVSPSESEKRAAQIIINLRI